MHTDVWNMNGDIWCATRLQGLPPGVQHCDCADLCTEVPWVGSDVAHHIGRSSEQDGVDRALVLAISAAGAGKVKTTW
jgi:hypothetical protein